MEFPLVQQTLSYKHYERDKRNEKKMRIYGNADVFAAGGTFSSTCREGEGESFFYYEYNSGKDNLRNDAL